jgi:hypothetical protein
MITSRARGAGVVPSRPVEEIPYCLMMSGRRSDEPVLICDALTERAEVR